MSSSARHESAHLHVQGLATYIDDLPLTEGTLHAAPILSSAANGRIISLDLSAVMSAEGVRAVVTAEDIPGDKLLSSFTHDEPVFASHRVEHIGQVLGLVVADTHLQARTAAHLAVLKVQAEQAQLNARDAQSKNTTVLPRVHVAIPRRTCNMRPTIYKANWKSAAKNTITWKRKSPMPYRKTMANG